MLKPIISSAAGLLYLVISIYALLCAAVVFLTNKLNKRRIFKIARNSLLLLILLEIGSFFIYASLHERIAISITIYMVLMISAILGLFAFSILTLKPVKKYFNVVDPKIVHLSHSFFGRLFQKIGIKVKLATLFTGVLVFLIAIISFIFIVRQIRTSLNQTKDFCKYATEEVAEKVYNYILQADLTTEVMLREFPINLKRYSRSLMVNGFSSATVDINWQQQNFFKTFQLKVGAEEIQIADLKNTYENEVLFREGAATSIYHTMNLIILENQKFKADILLSRYRNLLKTAADEAMKKEFTEKIEGVNKRINEYNNQIKQLNQQIDQLRFNEEALSNTDFYTFRHPIVVFGRKRNPKLDAFEIQFKKEYNEKFEEKVEKLQKIFYEDNGRLKMNWVRNPFGFRFQVNAMLRQDEYLAQKVFKMRVTQAAQKKYEDTLDKDLKKAIEKKVRDENISELVEAPKLLGMVVLSFNKSELYQPIYSSINFVVMIAVIILGAGMFLIIFLAIRITRPMMNLVTGVQKIKHGDLDFTINLQSRDEFGFLTAEFNGMVVYLKENREMQKFISKETVSMIKDTTKAKSEVKLGGERKRMAFLFSDIRGFTSMSESRQPEEVVSIINTYLDKQSEVIESFNGDIDKYVGDEIMARFSGENMVVDAVQASVKIQEELVKMNKEREKAGLPVVEVGVGLNIGDVVVGSMGSHKRMDYTAIGDAVNLAARLCSAAEGGHVLVSKAIYDASGEFKKRFVKQEPIKVKGKAEPIEIFDIPKPGN